VRQLRDLEAEERYANVLHFNWNRRRYTHGQWWSRFGLAFVLTVLVLLFIAYAILVP
jgi:hypothetical protein